MTRYAVVLLLLLSGPVWAADPLTLDDRVSVLRHLDRVIDLRFDSINKELALYREDVRERLMKMNELRTEVLTDRAEFVRKGVYEAQQKALQETRDEVAVRFSVIETRLNTWIAAITVFLTILTIIINLYFQRKRVTP